MAKKSWHLDRRTFLRSSCGISLGLPFLDSMAAETNRTQTQSYPGRLCCIYFPYGIVDLTSEDGWWPSGKGRVFQFSPTLKPLETFRKDVTLFQEFQHPRVKVGGHQSADFFSNGCRYANQLELGVGRSCQRPGQCLRHARSPCRWAGRYRCVGSDE